MSFTVRLAADAASGVLEKGRQPELNTAAFNIAIQQIWRAYDWHWSIAKLPPFFLIPGVQDYGWPAITVPADLAAIRKAYFWDLRTSQQLPQSEVKVEANLGRCVVPEAIPKSICYIPAGMSPNGNGTFRIFPAAPWGVGSPLLIIDGEYKKLWTYTLSGVTYTRLQSGHDVSVNFPFGDQYFDVAVECMKWAFMTLSNHKDRGGAQFQNGVPVYYGQLAVKMSALSEMIYIENREQGNPSLAPDHALVGGDGIYGYWGY